jgi:hypothetical protein
VIILTTLFLSILICGVIVTTKKSGNFGMQKPQRQNKESRITRAFTPSMQQVGYKA